MDDKKNDTINIKNNRPNGFILPIVMILMLFFAFSTINLIDRLDDDRLFLQERQIAIELNLKKKIGVHDLLNILSNGAPEVKQGVINYPEGYQIAYNITMEKPGIRAVQARLNSGRLQNAFTFYYDDEKQAIIRWVD